MLEIVKTNKNSYLNLRILCFKKYVLKNCLFSNIFGKHRNVSRHLVGAAAVRPSV